MNQTQPSIWEVVVKSIVTHTVTYIILGFLASAILMSFPILGLFGLVK